MFLASIFLGVSAFGICLAKLIPIHAYNSYFEPNVTSADIGDMLEFHFHPNTHNVVRGDWRKISCQPLDDGFYSGPFQINSEDKEAQADKVFRINITNKDPAVYYCSVPHEDKSHCQLGMVGAINLNDEQDHSNFATYVSNARAVQSAITPDKEPCGGIVEANPQCAGHGDGSKPLCVQGNVTAPTVTAAASTPAPTVQSTTPTPTLVEKNQAETVELSFGPLAIAAGFALLAV